MAGSEENFTGVALQFKWFHGGNRFAHRFSANFPRTDPVADYNLLIAKLSQLGYIAGDYRLCWVDPEGDHILLDTAEALDELLSVSKDASKKCITLVSSDERQSIYDFERAYCPFGRHRGRPRRRTRSRSRSHSRSRSRSRGRHPHHSRHHRRPRNSGSSSSSTSSSDSSTPSESDFSVIRKYPKMAKKWKKHCKKARHGCMWRPKECEHLTRSEMQENGANKPDAPQPEAPGDTFRPPGDINCDHEQHHHHPTLAQCRGAAIHQQSCPPEGSFDVYHRCDSGMSRMGCLGPPLYSAPKKHFCRRHNLHTHKYDKKLHRLEKKLGRLSMATDTPQLQ